MSFSDNQTNSFAPRCTGHLLVLSWILALLIAATPALGGEEPCDGVADFPCGYALTNVRVQQAPTTFNFQARIGQAKIPSGSEALFPVLVNLVRDGEILCTETIDNISVKGGVLNVTIGRNMSCEMGEVLAENPNLLFQVCIGGPGGCLKPIALAVQPYAMKATYASEAMQADHANVAAQASYAHRATADATMFLRDKLGAGYFDFYSHSADGAQALYSEDEFAPYQDSGFIQWTPVRNPAATTLHIAGRDAVSGQIVRLDELVVAANSTRFTGDLDVQSDDDQVPGLTVIGSGETMHVFGDSSITGLLMVAGKVDAQEMFSVTGDLTSAMDLTMGDQVTVLAGGLEVAQGLHLTGGLAMESGMHVGALAQFESDATVTGGALSAQSFLVSGPLEVQGTAAAPTVQAQNVSTVNPLNAVNLAVPGGSDFQGELAVSGAMEVGGPVVIEGTVLLNGGTVNAGGDMRYVQAFGEQRSLNWGGAVAFEGGLGLGANLDLALHRAEELAMQVSAGPPVECTPEVDGLFYVDSDIGAMLLCSAGKYRVMGAALCGNGYVEPGEECDDNNSDSGDGCSDECTRELGFDCLPEQVQPTVCASICNDGLVRGNEICDDGPGGVGNGDGCAADCLALEPGWDCLGEPTLCLPICHDGMLRGDELCDQGPGFEAGGDGCAADCTAELGFTCTDEPSDCQPWICGDSAIDGPEECDDGNNEDGDGCTGDTCQVEEGWECEGEPSECTSCGNGELFGDEQCDDGNKDNGDGCSSECTIESGWGCNYQPSQCFEHEMVYFGSGHNIQYGSRWVNVPDGVKTVTFNVYGAAGAAYGMSARGKGGWIAGTLEIEPGKQGIGLYIGVMGGQHAGGSANHSGDGGEHSSVHYPGSISPDNAVLVAGGGGGFSKWQWTADDKRGGHGGYPNGTSGLNYQYGYGGGGTQSSGGQAYGACAQMGGATPGAKFVGGLGGYCSGKGNSSGGGGGSGYYGGGGGTSGGGGGGGSSYYDPDKVNLLNHITGYWDKEQGLIVVSW